jgi:RNA polymerase sigma-70 factor (ECF subfamily)
MTEEQHTEWEEIVELYYTSIFRFCRQFLGSHTEAQDATQIVFYKACKRLPTRKDKSTTRSWLYQIARNTCIDKVRWWKRYFTFRDSIEVSFANAPTTISKTLREAVSALPTRQREVFILRHWHDFSTEQTAEQLGITPGSVKTHLKRAIKTLRTRLENCVDHSFKEASSNRKPEASSGEGREKR